MCRNITVPGKTEYQRSLRKPHFSQDSGQRLPCCLLRGARASAQEKRQGWGETRGCSHRLEALSVAAAGILRANQGETIWSRQQDAFTTTDSNGNVRQFVLRCYCTFPVLITNYDSITPAWQFICSCLCSGRLGVGPLISRFHSSERSARRLSSAGAEDGRHRWGSDNCT